MLVGVFGYSQRLLLEMPYDPIDRENGPNRSHFSHAVFSFGVNGLPEQNKQNIDFWNSGNFNLGGRYIRKLSTRLAWSNDFLFNFFSYRININELDSDEQTALYGSSFAKVEQEGRSFFTLEYAPGLRFSTQKRRGNTLGRFIEIQGLGGLIFMRTTDVFGVDEFEKTARLVTMFKDGGPFYYGGVVRFGFNRVNFYTRYIANDIGRLNTGMLLYGVEFSIY